MFFSDVHLRPSFGLKPMQARYLGASPGDCGGSLTCKLKPSSVGEVLVWLVLHFTRHRGTWPVIRVRGKHCRLAKPALRAYCRVIPGSRAGCAARRSAGFLSVLSCGDTHMVSNVPGP